TPRTAAAEAAATGTTARTGAARRATAATGTRKSITAIAGAATEIASAGATTIAQATPGTAAITDSGTTAVSNTSTATVAYSSTGAITDTAAVQVLAPLLSAPAKLLARLDRIVGACSIELLCCTLIPIRHTFPMLRIVLEPTATLPSAALSPVSPLVFTAVDISIDV